MTNFNWLAIRDPTSNSAYAQDCIARSSDRINYDLQKAEQNQEVKRQVAISQRREKTQNYFYSNIARGYWWFFMNVWMHINSPNCDKNSTLRNSFSNRLTLGQAEVKSEGFVHEESSGRRTSALLKRRETVHSMCHFVRHVGLERLAQSVWQIQPGSIRCRTDARLYLDHGNCKVKRNGLCCSSTSPDLCRCLVPGLCVYLCVYLCLTVPFCALSQPRNSDPCADY